LFLLGALSEEDLLQLREHLSRGCEACRERLKEAARTVYLLSLSAKPVSPGPRAKADLLRLVKNK
jgi:predicted anti-sigma-YlaC factor YlaD